jgi:hypothetical protein
MVVDLPVAKSKTAAGLRPRPGRNSRCARSRGRTQLFVRDQSKKCLLLQVSLRSALKLIHGPTFARVYASESVMVYEKEGGTQAQGFFRR